MQISTFGQVLKWVRDRLSQVENNMNNSQSDPTAIRNVSSAKSAIDALINKDSHLEDEYIKAAEQEYKTLVELIQDRNIPITDEIEKGAEELLAD